MSDIAALATALLDACRKRGWMISTAESCTGGMVTAALTDIAGSSDVLDRGFVTYSNAAKTEMLGVSAAALAEHGAVSAAVAAAMAAGALTRSDAHLAVAITGVAGPGGSERKPEGLVWFGLAQAGGGVVTECREFGAIGRANVRRESVEVALNLLLSAAEGG